MRGSRIHRGPSEEETPMPEWLTLPADVFFELREDDEDLEDEDDEDLEDDEDFDDDEDFEDDEEDEDE
jgi:hypothetical protein